MTEPEFRAWLVYTRAEIAAGLAELDATDLAALTDAERAEHDALRAMLLELQAQTAPEVIDMELVVTEELGRELTPAELRALRIRQ